jgi:hypothetical protein
MVGPRTRSCMRSFWNPRGRYTVTCFALCSIVTCKSKSTQAGQFHDARSTTTTPSTSVIDASRCTDCVPARQRLRERCRSSRLPRTTLGNLDLGPNNTQFVNSYAHKLVDDTHTLSLSDRKDNIRDHPLPAGNAEYNDNCRVVDSHPRRMTGWDRRFIPFMYDLPV